jgi:hypothetical protein
MRQRSASEDASLLEIDTELSAQFPNLELLPLILSPCFFEVNVVLSHTVVGGVVTKKASVIAGL